MDLLGHGHPAPPAQLTCSDGQLACSVTAPIPREWTPNTGAAGQCVWWALNEFHQYDGLYPNTIDSAANNGNAMCLAANAAFNGWTVSSTPRADSIAVFQPGVNGALADGHVAWVTNVSGPYITISEMDAPNPFVTDTRTFIPASSVQYILAP
jgi:prepilin-type processing-associated H-X9-DG protein